MCVAKFKYKFERHRVGFFFISHVHLFSFLLSRWKGFNSLVPDNFFFSNFTPGFLFPPKISLICKNYRCLQVWLSFLPSDVTVRQLQSHSLSVCTCITDGLTSSQQLRLKLVKVMSSNTCTVHHTL